MERILQKFKYVIIILLAILMIFMFSDQYRSINQVVKDKYNSRQQLVEKNILETVNYINDAYKIVEQQLNKEMKEYSEQMIEKYRKNPAVMSWDLEEINKDFPEYDIYILDSSLKIIKTTYKDDLGLDFSKFGSFAKVIRRRLEGNSFAVDRIDLATQTGEIKKYSYRPTPDNKYLFELSIRIEDKYPSFKNLNMFRDATELTQEYDMVEDISFYSVEPLHYGVAKLRSSKKPYLDPDVPLLEEELARQAVINNNMQTEEVETANYHYRYRFFPALTADSSGKDGWNSYVVGIKYNDRIMKNEINKNRNLFFINLFLMVIFFISFITIVVYLLKKFEYQAYHDKLTGLANRKLFVNEFSKLKVEADNNGSKLGIIFIDIDNFKAINDNFGHAAGDKVLANIASRMKNSLKEKDILARLGGDEFIIALCDLESQEKIIKIAQRLIDNLKEPLKIEEKEISVRVSVGISFYPESGEDLEDLLKRADSAMYKAKKEDKDFELS